MDQEEIELLLKASALYIIPTLIGAFLFLTLDFKLARLLDPDYLAGFLNPLTAITLVASLVFLGVGAGALLVFAREIEQKRSAILGLLGGFFSILIADLVLWKEPTFYVPLAFFYACGAAYAVYELVDVDMKSRLWPIKFGWRNTRKLFYLVGIGLFLIAFAQVSLDQARYKALFLKGMEKYLLAGRVVEVDEEGNFTVLNMTGNATLAPGSIEAIVLSVPANKFVYDWIYFFMSLTLSSTGFLLQLIFVSSSASLSAYLIM
jgi:hypothetical protein